jgi:hypothetical protein
MGQAYQVRNAVSGRVEAMRFVPPVVAGRFMREPLAGLKHPNIVAMRVGDEFLLTTEFVEGHGRAADS